MKRLISFVLILALLTSLGLGGALAAGSGEGGRYTDVAESAWYYEDVAAAYELGLMEGVGEGNFAPTEPLSLAQAVTLAARARSLYLKDGESFTRHDEWYRVYVEYAIAGGIPVSADEDFEAPATRRRCAELFAAALPKAGLRAINRVDDGAIPDVESDAAVYTLYRAGVMIGDENHDFHPDDSIRRCEIAAVVNRLLKAENRLSVTLTLAREDEPEPEPEQDPGPSFLVDEDPVEFEFPEPEPVEEVFDAEGNSSVPYDLSHPEEFASGDVLYADETILIKFRLPFDGEVNASLRAAGVEKLEMLMTLEDAAWYTAYLRVETDVHEAVEAVRELRGVMLVEYDFVYAADGPVTDSGEVSGEVAGNEQIDDEWYINSVGIQAAWQLQLGSKSQIFLPKMLEENPEGEIPEDPQDPVLLSGGSRDVVVAVIDTGVDYSHPDLRANMWHNPGEIPENGIDDDQNGYVDDYYGVDIVAGRGSGNDDHGHGTHVAGIIAAVNNTEGIVGIAYNTRIMSVKAGMSSGYFSNSAIAAAVIYAADNGADVINMSFGGSAISIAVQDALTYAYTRCVLVAAAGNEGLGNDVDHLTDVPVYPAALPYVLGVMSVDRYGNLSAFSNYDCIPFNSFEYELYAPGEAMLSTIPGDRYAAWNGTSMAAPVVSAVAALLRSEFRERSTYPTKFIYGQLSGTGPLGPDGYHRILNAYSALTVLPRPDVNVTDYRLFDTVGFALDTAGVNSGDGVIDAGETVALGFFLRNHWGMAKNVTVSVDALSPADIPCPYLEVLTEEADYGSVGTYSVKDAGQIMEDELFTGWENPIYLRITPDCPNDYIIALNVHLTAENALDADDETVYASDTRLLLEVRRGIVLPSVISEDMTLTKDNYYIIPNSTTVPEGVTLTVEAGTKIQFWTDDPHDAYADQYMASLTVNGTMYVNGTAEEPVEMFSSELMSRYAVMLSGNVYLKHAVVTTPNISVRTAEDCEFRQRYLGYIVYRKLSNGRVVTDSISNALRIAAESAVNCVFYKLNVSKYSSVNNIPCGIVLDSAKGCAFIDCSFELNRIGSAEDCLFYGNNTSWNNAQYFDTASYSVGNYYGGLGSPSLDRSFRDPETGTRYLLVRNYNSEAALERFAEYLGGTLACIETAGERAFLAGALGDPSAMIGLRGAEPAWVNGAPFDSESWNLSLRTNGFYAFRPNPGGTSGLSIYGVSAALIELPGGPPVIETITLPRTEITLDMDGSYTIAPAVYPGTTEQGLRYFSGCEMIAEVDGNGTVTPVCPGSTRIYICSEDMAVQTTLLVTVKDTVGALALSFPEETLTLKKGDSLAWPAAVTPADSTKKPVYAVSDPGVLSVDEDGLFTALDVGVCTVNAAIPGTALTAAVTVTVVPRILSLTAAENVVCLAPAEGLDAAETLGVVLTQDGEGELPLSWLSSNPEVLDVNEDGELVFFTQPDTPGRWATLRVTEEYSGLYVEVAVCASDAANASPVRQFRYSGGYYALLEDGSLWYWGSGTPLPRRLSFAEDAVQFAVYSNYCLVLNAEGELNAYWLDGDYPVRNSDVLGTLNDSPMTGVRRISANAWHLYILTEDGFVWAMGNNNSGELGDGSTTTRYSLVQANTASLGPIADIVCGNYQLGVLTEDGELWVVGQYSFSAATAFILVDEDVAALHQLNNSSANSDFAIVYADGSTGYLGPHNASPAYYRPSCGGRFYHGANVLILDGLAYNASSYSGNNGVYTDFTLTLIPGVEQVEDVFSSGNSTTYFRTAGGFYGMGNNDDYAIPNLTVGNQTEPSRIRFGLEAPDLPLQPEGVSLTEDGNGGFTLEGGALTLDFNAALQPGDNYGAISLKEDATGLPIGLRKTIVLDKLTLEVSALADGESYTLTIPASALRDNLAHNNRALSYQFTYVQPEGAGETGDPTEPQEPQELGEFIDIYADGTEQLPEGTPRPDYIEEDFSAAAAEYLAKRLDGPFYHCAVINRLKDDEVEHWLRFTAPESTAAAPIPMGGNYWGTVNKTLIGLQIVDYNDFTQLRDIDEGEYLATAPETVWPFAVRAGLLDGVGTETDVIGNETVTFYAEFNRDMDTETPLRVRFGSAYPYADYEVEGDWVSDHRWEGTTTLTTIIENGYQFWSIGSGQSADGKKLYEDWGRFRFEIDNTAAMAMTMQGSANADGVILTWTQDDFDTLMGYNVYRAESLNGQYTRLNGTVIPAETTSWFDANVEPGVVYYYNFTVVKTDMNESAPSGRISIMTLDTMAPVLTHSPVYTAFSGNSLTVSATVTDNVGVQLVTLYYRTSGESGWHSAEMSRFNDRYSAVISSNYVTTAGLEYYIDAFDGVSHALRGSAEEPFAVTVQVAVADSDKGDVNGDRRISSVDALMLLRAINGRLNLTAEQFARADINGDGELTAAEAMRILQYANGKLSTVLY